jgi:uncharacterized membrane protein YjjB (DUF3815 family)
VFYNTAWAQVGMAALGGMAGHGLRFLALEAGCTLQVATLLGGLAVGVVAAAIARSARIPVAVISFAGAVTMIPGLHMYRALAGAMHLVRLPDDADPAATARMLADAFQACLVVSGLVLGLIVGARAVTAIFGEHDSDAGATAAAKAATSVSVESATISTDGTHHETHKAHHSSEVTT